MPLLTQSSLSSLLPSTRFTFDGSEELEEHLSRICRMVLAQVRAVIPDRSLEGLLLGGGYGRGEGGVLKTNAGEEPYNDLEFYIFLHGPYHWNERRHGAGLRALAHSLTLRAGVEVELKILTVSKLRRSPPSMFYYDLMMGHRRLWGKEDFLAGCARHCAAPRIPLSEATRLLMNRCSGLLFAKEHLEREQFTEEDADFTARNLAKAQLAFGDVLLTAAGEYHWSCRKREKRLETLQCDFPKLAQVRRYHAMGVQFKLHPEKSLAPRSTIQQQHLEISALGQELWLWLENRRLKQLFGATQDYSLSRVDKCPETKKSRNLLVNLKTFGPAVLFSSKRFRYPRQRMLEALPLLLWSSNLLREKAQLRCVQKNLCTAASGFTDLVKAYRLLWGKFN